MRTRRLASPSEIATHKILVRTLGGTEWNVFGNVSAQQVLEKDELLSSAEFDMYTRGSFDFVVFDANYDPVFVLEYDGFGHKNPRQVARDHIKNALCARARLPLLRIGAADLREPEETSILEWLCSAFVASEQELDAALADDADDLESLSGGWSADDDALPDDQEDDSYDTLGEPGAELEHPFPDNAVVSGRLMERYGIGIGQLSPLIAMAGTRYVLQLRWPRAFQPPRFRPGRASEFVVSEVAFVVAKIDTPGETLFSGVGRAEFAWAHRLPLAPGKDAPVAPVEFPWDALGVSHQLAEFDALRKVEGWASRNLKRAEGGPAPSTPRITMTTPGAEREAAPTSSVEEHRGRLNLYIGAG